MYSKSNDTSLRVMQQWVLNLVGTQELADCWWKSPNKAFSGKSPETVVAEGQQDLVYSYLLGHLSR